MDRSFSGHRPKALTAACQKGRSHLAAARADRHQTVAIGQTEPPPPFFPGQGDGPGVTKPV